MPRHFRTSKTVPKQLKFWGSYRVMASKIKERDKWKYNSGHIYNYSNLMGKTTGLLRFHTRMGDVQVADILHEN